MNASRILFGHTSYSIFSPLSNWVFKKKSSPTAAVIVAFIRFDIRYFIWNRKRKREFVYQEEEVKLRLIVMRTCICDVISHPYHNRLDVAERWNRVQGMKAPVAGLGGEVPPRGPGAEPLSGISVTCRGKIKCNFTAAPQAGKERFLFLLLIKIIINLYYSTSTFIKICLNFYYNSNQLIYIYY